MHVKKRYENAGATKLALQHAQSVADKVAAAVKEKTGIEPTIGLNGRTRTARLTSPWM